MGGRAIIAGEMSLGDFVRYIFFIGLVAAPLVSIASIGTQISEAFAGLDRIREIRDMATEDALDASKAPVPTLEPGGGIRADLVIAGRRVRVLGSHLDPSGLSRRQQLRTIFAHVEACGPQCPAVLMGDLNEWAVHGGALREFRDPWRLLAPGRSFPSRRPVAQFDRIAVSADWHLVATGVHHSALAARASDHLPVWAELDLPKK